MDLENCRGIVPADGMWQTERKRRNRVIVRGKDWRSPISHMQMARDYFKVPPCYHNNKPWHDNSTQDDDKGNVWCNQSNGKEKKTPVECAWILSPMTIARLSVWHTAATHTSRSWRAKGPRSRPSNKRKKTRTLRDLASTEKPAD